MSELENGKRLELRWHALTDAAWPRNARDVGMDEPMTPNLASSIYEQVKYAQAIAFARLVSEERAAAAAEEREACAKLAEHDAIVSEDEIRYGIAKAIRSRAPTQASEQTP